MPLAIADFDRDGRLDVATANSDSGSISVLLGRGDGTLGPATHFAAGEHVFGIAAADFNGDGWPDIAVSNYYLGTVSVLFGTGQATFAPRVVLTPPQPSTLVGLTGADVDRDGDADLFATNDFGGVWLFEANGNGTFETAVKFATTSASRNTVVDDFDRDGRLDLIVTNFLDGSVSFLRGDGSGSFAAAVNSSTAYGVTHVRSADVNGDGKLDLVGAGLNASAILTLLGNGDGTFVAPTSLSASGPADLLLGDFNRDGRPDVAIASAYSNALGVLLGGCADLRVALSHSGNFIAGQNHTYSIVVTNAGAGSTRGLVSVKDELPTGLIAVSMSGGGWNCDLATTTCTRSDARLAGSAFPAITLTVAVARNAPASVVNRAMVSGGGDVDATNNEANDPTTISKLPDLKITSTHVGNFAHGQTNATYTLNVGNIGSAATSGTVTVTDNLPFGFTATSLSGSGWSCTLASRTCTRDDSLAIDATYSPITVVATVTQNAVVSSFNSAQVSGGGDSSPSNNSASDATTVLLTPQNVTARISGNAVAVSWNAVNFASGYRVLRATSAGGPFTLIGTPISNSYLDTGVVAQATYFYRVQASDASNVTSESATVQASTPSNFTDDPLLAQTTLVKAQHFTEVREQIDALRQRAGLTAYAYSEAVTKGSWIRRTHLTEMRAALAEARAAVSLAPLTFTDAAPVIVRAVHLQELREALR